MLSPARSAWCTKAELNGNVDSENNHGGSSRDIRYYIGLDVHKKTISYCIKDASGQVHQEGKIGATRHELDGWMETLPQPWTVAMEATIFTGWIYDHLLPHAQQVKVAHPLMLRAIAAAKKKNDQIDASKIADCLRCNFLPECHMASTQIRDRRRTLRYRHLLVRQMVQMKNRISGLLMETGVSVYSGGVPESSVGRSPVLGQPGAIRLYLGDLSGFFQGLILEVLMRAGLEYPQIQDLPDYRQGGCRCILARVQEDDMLHWLWVALIGLVIGAVAKLIMPGKDPGGFIITALLGIAGSIFGTWVGRAVGWYSEGQSAGLIMSVLGAILILAIYHAVRRKPA